MFGSIGMPELIIILTMMVPTQLGLIPLYMLMTKMHLAGTLPAVILPFLVSGFGVFMMRQFVSQAVPDEMIDAARLDGASTLKTFWYVVLPVLRPAAAVLGLRVPGVRVVDVGTTRKTLPDFTGPDGPHHPVLGTWVVDGDAAGSP